MLCAKEREQIFYHIGFGCQKVIPAVPLGRWHKKIVQVAFVRWRGDSKIVEANAEHDFRLKRLIGMFRTIKRAQYFCAICQAALPG